MPDLTNTPEKFHAMAGEILPLLTAFLKTKKDRGRHEISNCDLR